MTHPRPEISDVPVSSCPRALRDAIAADLPHCLTRDRLFLANHLEKLWPPRNPAAVMEKLRSLREKASLSRRKVEKARKALPPVRIPGELPIAERAEELVDLIRKHPVVVIAGETGSGKTTQIPKLCLQAGLGAAGWIGCTQPRRIAALSVSRRVAEELQVSWGKEVGCAIRFQDRTAPNTFLKFMTDGILLNELHQDPLLSRYEVVIIDEAHERSLNIDFILGFLRQLRETRPDLKIIITSATIDTARFSEAFGNAPVVEVSGRLYPVDVRYLPVTDAEEDQRYDSQIEAAVDVASHLASSPDPGDILIFMSGERSIRETADLLEARDLHRTEILSLFGRLSAEDQQRIFRSSQRRKIIIATNIAETSITVPGIRYVIDTGVARISRYSPHTRTLRLPIEPVSQSSAKQRAGRCGRVSHGVCFRLYSEEDLLSRPEFTPPEIKRSNLASVILKLLDLGIQDVDHFPFMEPPEDKAIRGGYRLLEELGAIDPDSGQITAIGKKLVRLPVDPTIGRMLLAALKETCLREVLVIAAGISVQDPRERPMDEEEKADQAHREFLDPGSDFITLLNLWDAYHEAARSRTKAALRRWCRQRFLSYLRMREWRDIHDQLAGALKEIDSYRLHDLERDPLAIHRSILAGLLGNIARKREGNEYNGTHSRKVMIFPGSGLFDRKARPTRKGKTKAGASPPPAKSATPEWILCGEWVETSRLFARMVAAINPLWVIDLGKHLLKRVVNEARWDPRQGRVVATERLLIYGLEVQKKPISYARENPEEAEAIFIHNALVEADLEMRLPAFLEHNAEVRRRVETWQTQARAASAGSLDDRSFEFYTSRIGGAGIGSIADLNKWLKRQENPKTCLLMQEKDILLPGMAAGDREAFPETVSVGERKFEVNYQFKPGEPDDGATLRLPFESFNLLQAGMLDWVVPGYVEDKVEALLRGLPKEYRKALFPLAEKLPVILKELEPSPLPLADQLGAAIRRCFRLDIPPRAWSVESLPEHLKLRIELTDTKSGKTLVTGRDWKRLQDAFEERKQRDPRFRPKQPDDPWTAAASRYEKRGLTRWSFEDLPFRLNLGTLAGVPVRAWPGLVHETDNTVSLRLFRRETEARAHTRGGARLLAEEALARDLAWLKRDMKELKRLGPLVAPLVDFEQFGFQAWDHLLRYVFHWETPLPLARTRFEAYCGEARERMKGLPLRLADRLDPILLRRQELSLQKTGYPGMQADVQRLLPADFLKRIPFQRLTHLERYLKAIALRADRYRANPEKDQEKAARLKPYLDRYRRAIQNRANSGTLNRLYWLLEEYRVSLFAQELGTNEKVSPKILDQAFDILNPGPLT